MAATFRHVSTPRAPDGFVFDGPIAASGVSEVFRVRGESGACVCKRLGPRARDDAASWASIEREGRIVSALVGRGAPELAAAGVDDAGPFVVTRQLTMTPLGELDPRVVTPAVVRATFRALAEIHEAADSNGPLGIVHADVSPSNVMISTDGTEARFVDFGLATMRGDEPPRDGVFRGTLAFAAPEVARGEAIDVRADLFALAASLLSIAAGEPPRSASSDAALLGIAGSEPIDAWAHSVAERLGLDSVLVACVACVAFNRADRPARAREVCGT
jgi:serine/threonine protein kinase